MEPTAAFGAELVVAERTDPGCDPTKQVNEDACAHASSPLGELLVVCDGMGGHARGRDASQRAVATIVAALARTPPGTPPAAALAAAIAQAGRAVWELGATDPGRPGSTCVAVLVHGAGAEVAHVGDSRAHLVRRGRAWPLTRDHSLVQQLVDAGLVRPDEAAAHPDAGKITRALGLAADVEVDVRPEPLALAPEDRLVLASDGLTDLVTEAELALEASAPDPAVACERLVGLARARGAPDNVTVQIARVVHPGPAQPSAAIEPGAGVTVLAAEAPRTVTLTATAPPVAVSASASAPPATPRAPGPAPTLLDFAASPPSAPPLAPPHAELSGRRMIAAAALLVVGLVVAISIWALVHARSAPEVAPAPASSQHRGADGGARGGTRPRP